MDEMKPDKSRIEKKKAVLTDEQKAEIRLEMDKCKTEQEAREHRKFLAEYYGATLAQIAAVTAYKVNPDGSLNLTPQFPKTPVPQHDTSKSESRDEVFGEADDETVSSAPPQVEAVYDNMTKRAWREKIREAITDNFTPERLSGARVVCLPGQALQEVTEVYLPLGIRPENIVCIERDSRVIETMRVNAEKMNLPVTIFAGTVEKFLQSVHEPISIASFDFLGPVHKSFLESLLHIRKAEKFMIITNFLRKREQKDSQETLRTFTAYQRTAQARPNPSFKVIKRGSDLTKLHDDTDLEKNIEDVLSGRTPVELSTARDEGMSTTLAAYIAINESKHAVDDLFTEIGASSPSFIKPEEHIKFNQQLTHDIAVIFEDAFEKYPGFLKKLTPIRDENAAGIPRVKGRGRRGFLLFLAPTLVYCFRKVMDSGTQRYTYSSENIGSPYQTDILVFFDWKPSFREKHRDAYDFVRESLRVLVQNGKDAVTVRLERFGKVLPQTYSDSTSGVILTLCVNGVPHRRVALRSLQQMVQYFRESI